MIKPKNIGLSVIIVITWFINSSFLPSDKWSDKVSPLFIINRSRDANEIWYSVNFNIYGEIDTDNPIRIFWVKKECNNKIEPLTRIQNRYAYGIKILDYHCDTSYICSFQFVSHSKSTFTLRKKNNNSYGVFTTIKNNHMEVNRIFVQIEGESYWFPKIPYVKLTGKNINNGKEISDIIIP